MVCVDAPTSAGHGLRSEVPTDYRTPGISALGHVCCLLCDFDGERPRGKHVACIDRYCHVADIGRICGPNSRPNRSTHYCYRVPARSYLVAVIQWRAGGDAFTNDETECKSLRLQLVIEQGKTDIGKGRDKWVV